MMEGHVFECDTPVQRRSLGAGQRAGDRPAPDRRILLTRFTTWLGGRITDWIDASARETDALVRSEASKHRHALASVITGATLVVKLADPRGRPRDGACHPLGHYRAAHHPSRVAAADSTSCFCRAQPVLTMESP